MTGNRKKAVFDEKVQEKILEVCSEREFVPVYLMMRCGIHSVDVTFRNGRWKVNRGKRIHSEGLKFDGTWLEYKRCKTDQARRLVIAEDVRQKLQVWLERGQYISPAGLSKMVQRVGLRVGIPNLSPMSLRHTFGLQCIRKYKGRADAIHLTAAMMGCTPEVATSYYLDHQQWESLGDDAASTTPEAQPIEVDLQEKPKEAKKHNLSVYSVISEMKKKASPDTEAV